MVSAVEGLQAKEKEVDGVGAVSLGERVRGDFPILDQVRASSFAYDALVCRGAGLWCYGLCCIEWTTVALQPMLMRELQQPTLL